ncbi:MAG: S-adenosylmethionine decarboxylase [Parcubacteria group bacterium]
MQKFISITSNNISKLNSSSLKQDYEDKKYWGLETTIDLYNCDPETIRNAEKIKAFVIELCDRIDMKRFGQCVVVNFGEEPRVSGFSMTQLIETSLISGHFANQSNAVYLNIFSCRYFSPEVVGEYAKEFFGASNYILSVNLRK